VRNLPLDGFDAEAVYCSGGAAGALGLNAPSIASLTLAKRALSTAK
jgi:hypothetical protein